MKFHQPCSVCGGTKFSYIEVLWAGLINEWGLSVDEVAYVNRQQGMYCTQCGNNLRSIALADAMLSSYQFTGVLVDFIASEAAKALSVLEINEAGGLSPILAGFPKHKLVEYPSFDMMSQALKDESYDLIVHSDTLEHLPNPELGLAECRRVLKPGGVCIFTVPIIVGRQSRSRQGLPESYHGAESRDANDLTVHYEFGSDFWEFIARAGYKSITNHILEYPAALAIIARK